MSAPGSEGAGPAGDERADAGSLMTGGPADPLDRGTGFSGGLMLIDANRWRGCMATRPFIYLFILIFMYLDSGSQGL